MTTKDSFKFIPFVLAVLLSACLIDNESLDPDIRYQFENAEESSAGDEYYLKDCTLAVTDRCIFSNEASFIVSLKGNSKGYKYFLSDYALSREDVYKKVKSETYHEGNDVNYITINLTPNGKKRFLYVVAYGSPKAYGDYEEVVFYELSGSQFTTTINILNLRKTGSSITWNFSGSNYPYYYVILEGREAEFANELSETAFALYMQSKSKYHDQTNSPVDMSYSINEKSQSILIGTRAVTSGGDLALSIRRQFIKL